MEAVDASLAGRYEGFTVSFARSAASWSNSLRFVCPYRNRWPVNEISIRFKHILGVTENGWSLAAKTSMERLDCFHMMLLQFEMA